MNAQNIPPGVRFCFVAPTGCLLGSGDYKNIEARIMAYETNDQKLIDFLEAGGDIHDQNTRLLFEIDKDHPKYETYRLAAKKFFFGRICFGGSDWEIYTGLLTEVPEARITMSTVKKMAETYMADHPEYLIWHDKVQQLALKERVSLTFAGRKRALMDNERQILKHALNTPTQGGAAHVINRAMNRIQNRLDDRKFKTKLLLQVHDELVFEIPFREILKAKKMILEEMQRPIKAWNREVIFPVEWKTGTNWGELS